MNKETMVHQLLAIRSSVDAMLSELGGEMEQICKHKRTENLTTMGGEETYRCLDCGVELKGENIIKSRLKERE